MRFLLTLAISTGVLCAQTGQQQSSQELLEKTKAAAQATLEQQKKGTQAAPSAKPAKPTKPMAPGAGPQAAPQAPQANIMTAEPSKVIATVDAQPVTAGELQAIIGSLDPQVQQQATGNLNALLQQYGVTRRLAAEAQKNKLDQASPYKDALEITRIRILAQAEMSYHFNTGITVPEDDVKAAYAADKDKFQQARVKAIYIPFTAASATPADPKAPKAPTEAEAKAKVDEVVKQARAGGDFVKLVKEYSKDANSVAKDGDFGVIARNAPMPEHIKTAIFALKAGQVTDPVRQPNGFYVFRVEEITTPPFDQIRANLVEQIKNAKFSEWLQEQQRQVKIEGLTSSAGPQQPPQPQAAK
ncbi:MAG TPA: peptidylprolyl isomerase [Bryobacteraceae bacterium]|nr:peptidylprolyl isomerase [Bryobacteraceae bacterium]